jgi:hypothetical protein
MVSTSSILVGQLRLVIRDLVWEKIKLGGNSPSEKALVEV